MPHRRPEFGNCGHGGGVRHRRTSGSGPALHFGPPGQSWKKWVELPAANKALLPSAPGGARQQTPVVHEQQRPTAPQPDASAAALAVRRTLAESKHSGEDFLMEMLASMDQHMQQLRKTQQGLVAIIELSCRRALGAHFSHLMLVGSAALRVETPGSDIDIVCFTRRDRPHTVGLPAEVLRWVDGALRDLISQYSDYAAHFSMELRDDARVPILRVLWGSAGSPVAVDVSVDQGRSVDHVRWFQRVGAAPRSTAPQPVVAPLVTLTLRCVKWWLRQRQIPRTKEGGLPTLAWLLMVVHVCSLPETHDEAIIGGPRPMAALLVSLTAFFRHYAALQQLDGVLQFAADGSSSEFRRHTCARAAPWAELVVLDPTREGAESLNLVPRLLPATQLLLAHELRRAGQRLEQVPRGCEASFGESRCFLEDVFEPLVEGVNVMPSFLTRGNIGVLLLLRGGSAWGDVCSVEFGLVELIVPRPGWAAPFLHRSDERSELHIRLCNVDEHTGQCRAREAERAILSPNHFICRAPVLKEGQSWRLEGEGMERLRVMRSYLKCLSYHSPEELEHPTQNVGSGGEEPA